MPKARVKNAGRRSRRSNTDQGLVLYRNVAPSIPFKCTRVLFAPITATVSDNGNYITHCLSDLTAPGDFTSLFDMWRITGVDVTFDMTSGSNVYPTLYLSQDNADATPPTAVGDLLQRSNVVVHQFSPTKNSFTRHYKPQPQQNAYQGIAPAFSLSPPGTWISTLYPGVLHYGMKWWLVDFNSATPSVGFILRFRYYLEFKGTK